MAQDDFSAIGFALKRMYLTRADLKVTSLACRGAAFRCWLGSRARKVRRTRGWCPMSSPAGERPYRDSDRRIG